MLSCIRTITKLAMVVEMFLIFITFGCSLNKGASESTDYGVLAGRRLSESEVVAALRAANFDENVIPKMVCTAWYESGWRAESYNRNKNGTLDFGLFQINSRNWSYCKTSKAALADPVVNARCAKKIYGCMGLSAWYGYKSHAKTCNAYVLKKTQLKLTDSEQVAQVVATPALDENPGLEASDNIGADIFKDWGNGSETQVLENCPILSE